jgi:hypothetical protein
MSDPAKDSLARLDIDLVRRIDDVCRRFEAVCAWFRILWSAAVSAECALTSA